MMITSCVIILFLACGSLAFPGASDEVIILPGLWFQPSFKHYSGYLNGSDTAMLHYWFVESQTNHAKDPLVLWLNGGPGCSSVDGLLTEHGPFRVTNESYLIYNPFSWNQIANIIYLESPACVGYSYSTIKSCMSDDDSVSLSNFNALKHFLLKFPQYKGRDFYVTGESYGGYYVPTLAERILNNKGSLAVNFKGIAVGNGFSSIKLNMVGNTHFAYNHGLVSNSLWTEIINNCCDGKDPLHCDMFASNDITCQNKINEALNNVGNINPYNIYASCYSQSKEFDYNIWKELGIQSMYDRSRVLFGMLHPNEIKLRGLRQFYKNGPMLRQGDPEPIPCTDDRPSTKYMNIPQVRRALHIYENLTQWSVCTILNYTTIYQNMSRQYNRLFLEKDFRIWIYNGDIDMMCSYLSDEWFFERLNRTVVAQRQPWTFTDENEIKQVGGYVKIWDKFVLITIRGAGHMVPTDKPIPAFHMFQYFLLNKSLLK